MHSVLVEFSTPVWLQGFLPETIAIHTYGFLIATGALVAYMYLSRRLKKRYGVPAEQSQNLFIFLVVGAFIGGKLLFYLEDPAYYFGTPANMIKNMAGGFVFYGSLLACIPIVLWFAKKHEIPLLQMLDGIAITACLVHFFGRLGCFGAGCCHGLPYDGIFSVVYTDPICMAKPLNTGLHPTQLYSVALIGSILLLLLWLQKRQKFDGQLFLIYTILYAMGRSIIEIFRGDYQRGFIIEGYVSHSQLISLLMVVGVLIFYRYMWKKAG